MEQPIVKTPKKLPMKDLAFFYGNSNNKDKTSIYSGFRPTPEKETEKEKESEVLLIINVDIGQGDDTKVFYHKDDEPDKLAEEFCKKYGLDMSLKGVLERNIVDKVVELRMKNSNKELEENNVKVTKECTNNNTNENNNIYRNELNDKIYNYNDYSEIKRKNNDYVAKFMSEKKSRPEEVGSKNFTFSPNINKISKEIMKVKNQDSVYKRLYFGAKVKNTRKTNEQEEQDRLIENQKEFKRSSSAKNIGHQMYAKAMIRLERMKETEKLMKLKEEESILRECSHRPKVNPISEMIVDYKRGEKAQKVETFLLGSLESKMENLNKAKKERLQQEMKECTFKPKVNEFLSEKKQRAPNIYHDLYNDYKTFEMKKEKLKATPSENFTFQPKINKTTNKIVQDFDFYQRLQIFEQMRRQKLQNTLEKVHSAFDPSTGQPYFQPRINFNSSASRSDIQAKIWDFLYNERFRKQEFVAECVAKEKIANNFGIPKLSARSNELFEEKKLNLVIQMFGFFDSDNDGVISVDKINLENAPKEFLKVLIPISLKIAEKNDGMGVEEFYREFCQVYKGLTCHEKGELYKRSEEIGGNLLKEWKERTGFEEVRIMNEEDMNNTY